MCTPAISGIPVYHSMTVTFVMPASEEGLFLEVSVPATINRFLRGYQREGVRFLYRQYCRGTGGILADDMGLGESAGVMGAASRGNRRERG